MADGVTRIPPGPGQESVWDYPRPPRVEPVPERLRVVVDGEVLAETSRGYRVLETAGAPVYYFPPEDVRMDRLGPSPHHSVCEWKGDASYYQYAARWPRHREHRVDLPGPESRLRGAARPPRLLRGTRRRGVGRRRARDAATGPLLRRLGHVADRRADQGRAGLGRLVDQGARPRPGERSVAGRDAEDVEPAVHVQHLAGHGARQVRGEVERAPADVLGRDVGAQRRDLGERPGTSP